MIDQSDAERPAWRSHAERRNEADWQRPASRLPRSDGLRRNVSHDAPRQTEMWL